MLYCIWLALWQIKNIIFQLIIQFFYVMLYMASTMPHEKKNPIKAEVTLNIT